MGACWESLFSRPPQPSHPPSLFAPTPRYVGFVFIVGFALLNLYIGVIFSQFTKMRSQGQGSAFLTGDQQEWAELTKMVFKLKPAEKAKPPANRLRRACFSVAVSSWFENLVMAVILVNLGFLAAFHYGNSPEFLLLSRNFNYLFTLVYVLEAAIKITGLGWRMYWKVRVQA